MHALVWHQSGGEPWSFTVPGERGPRVYRKLRDAVRQANASNTDRPIRVGLAVLGTNASAVTETTFLPCPNMAAAARQINQLTARREASSQSDSDRTFCGIVAYRGSWERPSTAFARAVRATVANDDAPNFDMPKETGIEVRDALLDMPPVAQTRPPSRPEQPSETTNTPGRAHCFRRSESNPTTHQTPHPTTTQLQRNCHCNVSKTLNVPLPACRRMACLCPAR